MALSTLHSRSLAPRGLLGLLSLALLAWLAGAWYTLHFSPEVAYDRHSHFVKMAWAQKLDRDFTNKIVVFGGSSCRASIKGEQMLREHGLPTVNLGLSVGMGPKVLTRYAFQFLRPGDTLVMALEPGVFAESMELPDHAVQFAFASRETALLRDGKPMNWPAILLDLRPGAYHIFTLLGKIVLRLPAFRYPQTDLHADGWQEIADRRSFVDAGPAPAKLSEEGRAWLAHIRDACSQRGVRVCYSLPWYYTSPSLVDSVRRQNAKYLLQVAEFLPVLKDPMLGVDPVREHFADTALHLNACGATERTDQLSRELKAWEIWSPGELVLQ